MFSRKYEKEITARLLRAVADYDVAEQEVIEIVHHTILLNQP